MDPGTNISQTEKPARIEINVENIPHELVQRPQWIVWNWEKRNKKLTKPPRQVNGNPAKSNDSQTWTTFENVIRAYQRGKWDGIGFMLTMPYVGIDLDDCRNPETGDLRDWAKALLNKFRSYSEVSPSQKGVKILLKGNLPGGGHHNERVGVFQEARYFCITGILVDGFSAKIQPWQKEIDAFIKENWPEDITPPPEKEKPPTPPQSLKDQELIDKMLGAKNGQKILALMNGKWKGDYPSQSEADQALVTYISFWTQDPTQIDRIFRQSSLYRDKWDRQDYRNRTIRKALAQTMETYSAPKARQKQKPRGMTLEQLRGKFAVETDWLWRHHIPRGQPIILNGREGIGKTTIAMVSAKEILQEIATGSVVWLATEGKVLDAVNKMEAIGLNDRFYVAQKSDGTYKFNFQWKSDVDELDSILTDLQPTLAVYVDSIRGMSPLGDNDDKIGGVMHKVNAVVCDKYRAALLYIDHWGKGKKEDLLDKNVGTTAKTAAVSAVISLASKTKYTREIRVAKSNIGQIPDLISYQAQDQILIHQPHEETEETITTRAEAFLLDIGLRQKELHHLIQKTEVHLFCS